jgi:Rps23 Pro-64 3,4-dihydroxylase Tpa1-like proline 4-hydroxylase
MSNYLQPQPLGDPKSGVFAYHGMLAESLNLVGRLEQTIGDSNTAPYMWMEALVGDQQKMPEYRDCVDCKISTTHLEHLPPQFEGLRSIYDDTVAGLKQCMSHYQSMYNITMDYMEAINYVRYKPGQHFAVHSDSGFSYNCTVSSVMYLNDEYEGGELWFPFLDLTYKPKAGDIVIFPSTYIYAHASKPITSGVKYSAVTMFDWNDRTHKNYGPTY